MDHATYTRLEQLLVQQEMYTIEQFRERLSRELGSGSPLVQRLANWDKHDYNPEQLLDLMTVLRDRVTSKTPTFGTSKDTDKLLRDDTKGNQTLRSVVGDLFVVQRLKEWVEEYKCIYDCAINAN